MRYWTHYWRENSNGEGLFDHTAGNGLRKRGIRPGDVVYGVSAPKGKLFLIGRMVVERIVDYRTARRLLTYEPYDAEDHLIAVEESASRITGGGIEVPPEIVRQLRFLGRGGLQAPKFRLADRGLLDQQTLRACRELTGESASLLDTLLDPREARQAST